MHLFMKFAAVAALAISTASAQDLSGLPACAETPAVSALGSSGCALTDIKCICEDTSFLDNLAPAVEAVCDASDLQKTLVFAQQLCASVGVTLTAPTSGASSDTTAPTVTASASISASAVSGTTAAAIVTVIPDGQPQVPTSGAPISTGIVAPTTNTSSNVTSPSPSPFEGAAASFGAQVLSVGVLVGVAGAFFIL
ncbi:hypothetical protein MMC06_000749 [Schaereria dolodes]|nr:hypothetical protein [Schaereria dolodes]